jgi:signal transduction histidine kinase
MFLKTKIKKFIDYTLDRIKHPSLRSRLTFLFILIFGTTTLAFSIFIYTYFVQTLQSDFDDALYNYAIDISESVNLTITGDLSVNPQPVEKEKIYPFSFGTALIQIRHRSGKIVAKFGEFGKFNPPFEGDFQLFDKGDDSAYHTIDQISIPSAEADSYRLINFPLDSEKKPTLMLQIAVPMTLFEKQVQSQKNFLIYGLPFVLFIATLGGLFVSSRALAPVLKIISKAQEIRAEELSLRLPVSQTTDEIGQLSMTLNEMLDRIEKAFLSQERFIADASHQLLSPLTIMKAEIEAAYRGLQNSQNLDPAVNIMNKSLNSEIDHLIHIVKDMLLLARIDAGKGSVKFEEVYFEDIVIEALSRCEKLAQKKSIRLHFNIKGQNENHRKTIKGDHDLLVNLVFNLMENAIKYSPNNSIVILLISWTPENNLILSVEDFGSGITEQQLPFIFERFHRGSKAEIQAQGYGLGLAISKKIAQLHHGTLRAEIKKSSSGTVFYFEIKNI